MMDMKQRVSDLIVIASRLAEILERENRVLRAHKTSEIAPFVEDKTNLSRAYESRVRGMVENAPQLETVDPAACERLKSLGEKLKTLIEENARLLKVAMAAHQQFVSSVARAVKETTAGPGLYSRKGAVRSDSPRVKRSQALSLDQTL